MNKWILILFLVIVSSWSVYGQQKKIYRAERRTAAAPRIDGLFDEACWQQGAWGGDFVQREPHDGEKPSQQTFFKVCYDDNNIYVAIKALDTEPAKIDSRKTRRDQQEGDMVGVHFDSYHDRRTSFSFFVNAAGVKSDVLFSDGGNKEDDSWNPIWLVKTSKDAQGWYAEIKIPLSQLRFSSGEDKVWGFEVSRYINRKQELSLWNPVPLTASGWVYHFGELHGLKNIKPRRIIELAPYVSGGLSTYEKEEGNPYATGSELLYRAGIDGKVGITNDFVLNFTINPDFGQVEADPSEVNLTAFETYFSERRPFFVEGSNITDFKIQPGDHDAARDNLFYTRRIGRIPQHYPEVSDSEYVDFPTVTNILGAAKVTGKTRKGLSLGIMESVTREEKAEIASGDRRRQETVEPNTNYFVARAQKDWNKGNTIFGGELTSTRRNITDSALMFLPSSALSGGLDFARYWDNQRYYFTLRGVGSHLSGDSLAIIERQAAPQRYFQRPDASYLHFDSSLTSLSGYGGNLSAGKQVETGLAYGFNLSFRSPGLALNDIGYLRSADKISQSFSLSYKFTEPKLFYRKIDLGLIQWNGWDYGGRSIFNGGMSWIITQFKDNSTLVFRNSMEFNIHDNNVLRGGPGFYMPGNFFYRANYETNTSKKLYGDVGTRQGYGVDGSMRRKSYDMGIAYRPNDLLLFKFDPNISFLRNDVQYVGTYEVDGQPRYILARINQTTMHWRFRVNVNITPNLTIQYFASPFISTGKYSEFKVVTDPDAREYTQRFHVYSGDDILYDEGTQSYSVDENGDGQAEFAINNPDYEFKQFQSNLVVRWEYVPGSTIFLVWNQVITNDDGPGYFDFYGDMGDLFGSIPYNVFLFKFSYRFYR